jgi:hypothetical protein
MRSSAKLIATEAAGKSALSTQVVDLLLAIDAVRVQGAEDSHFGEVVPKQGSNQFKVEFLLRIRVECLFLWLVGQKFAQNLELNIVSNSTLLRLDIGVEAFFCADWEGIVVLKISFYHLLRFTFPTQVAQHLLDLDRQHVTVRFQYHFLLLFLSLVRTIIFL